MKQRYAVVVLFALIVLSGMVSLTSYKSTERRVTDDMRRALGLTLMEQQSNVISADTIRKFNSHLQMEALRGRAVLTVDMQKGFQPLPQCSVATVFALSEQRPALFLWTMAALWGMFCLWQRRHHAVMAGEYGGLSFSEANHRFYNKKGVEVKLTPMQQQLLEMFFNAPSHTLTKREICNALWPKKDDASETLYTLIRRIKPVVEKHSRLMIASNRGRSYELKVR